jgi:hypothetical protein
MAKKKILYDESPAVPDEKLFEEYDDLGRLNNASLIRRYNAIYKTSKHRKDITLTRADVLLICELISENNTNLLTLFEHKLKIKFLS